LASGVKGNLCRTEGKAVQQALFCFGRGVAFIIRIYWSRVAWGAEGVKRWYVMWRGKMGEGVREQADSLFWRGGKKIRAKGGLKLHRTGINAVP